MAFLSKRDFDTPMVWAFAETFEGTDEQDTLEGTAGDDLIRGYGKGDQLFGGAGDDTLEGGAGQDLLDGGEGADKLYGGSYNDTLEGGDGNDTLDGGSGQDVLKGGKGSDVYVLSEGDDTIEGYNAGDRIVLSDELKAAGLNEDDVTIETISVDGQDAVRLSFVVNGKTHTTTVLDAKLDVSVGGDMDDAGDGAEGLDEYGYAEDDYHILIANEAIEASNLPTSGGSVKGFDRTDLGDGNFEIRAVFDWDNNDNNYWMDWLLDVKQVGSRTLEQDEVIDSRKITSSGRVRNQLKDGEQAFKSSKLDAPEAIANLDTSNLVNMDEMFGYSPSFNADISDWDVSNVKSMYFMFSSASAFNADIGGWNVSNVENFGYMFSWSGFNKDISDWSLESAKILDGMFVGSGAADLSGLNIGNWDVSNVESMYGMFQDSTFNEDVGDWDVSNVKDLQLMFIESKRFNRDLSRWNIHPDAKIDAFDEGELFNWKGESLGYFKADGWSGNRETQSDNPSYKFVNRGRPNFEGGDVDGSYDDYSYYEIIGTGADESYGGSGLEDGYSIRITPIPQGVGYSWGVRNEFGDRVDFKGTKFNNLIDGKGGDDVLFGGDGDDILIGGAGKDVYQLASGNDIIAGFEKGKDSIVGLEEYGWSEEDTKAIANAAVKSEIENPEEEIEGQTFKYKYTLNYTIDGEDASTTVYTNDRLGDGELEVIPEPEAPGPGEGPSGGGESGGGGNGSGGSKDDDDDDDLVDAPGGGSSSDGIIIDGQPIAPSPTPEEPDPIVDPAPPIIDTDPGANNLRVKAVVVTPADEIFSMVDEQTNQGSLKGSTENDKLSGFKNKVTLKGKQGDDYLYGSSKKDKLKGAAGDDVIQGGKGKDKIIGGVGDDFLYGGKGKDVLTGGKGDDVFVLSKGKDKIKDFTIGEDDIGVVYAMELVFTDTADGMRITGIDGVDTLVKGVNTAEFLENFPNDLASTPVVQVDLF